MRERRTVSVSLDISVNRAASSQLCPPEERNHNSTQQQRQANQIKAVIECHHERFPPYDSIKHLDRLPAGRPCVGAAGRKAACCVDEALLSSEIKQRNRFTDSRRMEMLAIGQDRSKRGNCDRASDIAHHVEERRRRTAFLS